MFTPVVLWISSEALVTSRPTSQTLLNSFRDTKCSIAKVIVHRIPVNIWQKSFALLLLCFRRDQAFDSSLPAPSSTGTKDMWGANSRVVALFPQRWDLRSVVDSVEEVSEQPVESGTSRYQVT